MKRRFRVFMSLIVVLLGISSNPVLRAPSQAMSSARLDSAHGWPMPGYDLVRSGATSSQVSNPGSGEDLDILWVRDFATIDNERSELIGRHVQPSVVQGMVFVPTLSNRLHALDAESGETRWVFDAGEPGAMLCSPAIAGGIAYVGSTDGCLYAIDVSTGQERWRFQAGQGGFGASPAVTADTVYIGGRDGVFYAVHAGDGRLRWSYDVRAMIMNSPAVDETRGLVFFGAEDMRVYALSTLDGSLVWRTEQLYGQSFRHFYPVLVGDTLFIRTTPAMERYKVLQDGDDVILQAAGVPNNNSKRAILEEDPIDLHAPWTQEGWDAEISAIRQFLVENPEYQTWYALDVERGEQRYVVPILWAQGSGYVGGPPVVRDADHIIAYIRSYYSNLDLDSYYLFGGLGEIEVSTGNLSIINLAEEPGDSGALWTYGIGVIGDEQSLLSLGGDVLYVMGSQGLSFGGIDLLTGEGVRGVVSRSDPWGQGESIYPFVGSHTRHGIDVAHGQGGAIVPDRGRIYWITHHTVGALAEPGTVQVPWSPLPDGDEPVDPVRSVRVPDPSVLRPYVLNVPGYRVDRATTADLRQDLETQVSRLLTIRYAPLLFMPGKNVIRFYFQDPADLFYTLSIALPYLSPDLQAQAKDYLAREWQQYNPLTTQRYPLDEGQRRELYRIGPEALADGYDRGSDSTPERVEILYAVWAYAHYAGRWDVVADNWDLIKNLVASAIDPGDPDTLLSNPDSWSLGSVNRRTSALIAYTRMAQQMDDAAAYTWGLNAATRSLAARIEHEEANRPTLGEWHVTSREGGRFVYRSGSHRTWIPRYRDLTPEVGAALRDYAAEDLADQAEYLRVVRPDGHMVWGRQFAGEVGSNFPQHAIDIFSAQAMMLGASPEELRYYLDQRWCRGDLYYVQKLVYTIRAHTAPGPRKEVNRATASVGDTLAYTITLVGSGMPMTLTDPVPADTVYVPGSAYREPAIGALLADATSVTWTGTLTEDVALHVTFAVTITATEPRAVINRAQVDDGDTRYALSAITIANGLKVYLPVIWRGHW
jgi:uncharacterized repeat protein (TIGR01451 family)